MSEAGKEAEHGAEEMGGIARIGEGLDSFKKRKVVDGIKNIVKGVWDSILDVALFLPKITTGGYKYGAHKKKHNKKNGHNDIAPPGAEPAAAH